MAKYQLNNVPIEFLPPQLNRNEIFVPVNSLYYGGIKPYYLISSFGRVFNKYTGNFLSIYLRGKENARLGANFQFYTLDGKTIEKRIFVHRAMMISFYYRPDCDNLEIDHVDGVWYHNYLNNLEWVTKEENYNRFLKNKEKKSIILNDNNLLNPAPLYFDESFTFITNNWIPYIIPGKYMISNYGRVYDRYTDTFCSGYMDNNKIIHINLETSRGCINIPLTELIGKVYYNQNNQYAKMIDDKTSTLFIKDNITLSTNKEIDKNIKYVNGQRIHVGEGSNLQVKLNEEKVHQICKLLEENKLSLIEIANMFHVTKDAVYRIKKGDNWNHISYQYNLPKVIPRGMATGENNPTSKYKESQIRQICELLEQHKYSNVEIANKTNTNKSLVSHIKNHKQWNHISKEYNF